MPYLDAAIAQSAGPMSTIVRPVATTLVTTTWNSPDHLEIFLADGSLSRDSSILRFHGV